MPCTGPPPFDVVVTTNSGYPLDQNLYQAVKGMSAAAMVVSPGGTIIARLSAATAFPKHGSYRDVLASAANPAKLLEMICTPGYAAAGPVAGADPGPGPGQGDGSPCGRTGSTDDAVRAAHLEPIPDVGDEVERLLAVDPGARICVLPQGPQTIAYVA